MIASEWFPNRRFKSILATRLSCSSFSLFPCSRSSIVMPHRRFKRSNAIPPSDTNAKLDALWSQVTRLEAMVGSFEMLLVKYGIPPQPKSKLLRASESPVPLPSGVTLDGVLLLPLWQLPANLPRLPSWLITLGSSPLTASLPLWSSPKILWGMWSDAAAVA